MRCTSIARNAVINEYAGLDLTKLKAVRCSDSGSVLLPCAVYAVRLAIGPVLTAYRQYRISLANKRRSIRLVNKE
jgi:hypothetical protein